MLFKLFFSLDFIPLWIRICIRNPDPRSQMNTDPDPHHWLLHSRFDAFSSNLVSQCRNLKKKNFTFSDENTFEIYVLILGIC